jgi:hypothetical protein
MSKPTLDTIQYPILLQRTYFEGEIQLITANSKEDVEEIMFLDNDICIGGYIEGKLHQLFLSCENEWYFEEIKVQTKEEFLGC